MCCPSTGNAAMQIHGDRLNLFVTFSSSRCKVNFRVSLSMTILSVVYFIVNFLIAIPAIFKFQVCLTFTMLCSFIQCGFVMYQPFYSFKVISWQPVVHFVINLNTLTFVINISMLLVLCIDRFFIFCVPIRKGLVPWITVGYS